jgi:hypothetical protein
MLKLDERPSSRISFFPRKNVKKMGLTYFYQIAYTPAVVAAGG